MKTICYNILVSFIMLKACNPLYKEHTLIHFENNSDKLICFTIPDERHYKNDFTPDTTMMSYWGHVSIKSLVENESCTIACSFDTYEEWIPCDSRYYSLFVYEWEAHREVSEHVDVDEEHFKNDEYYIRYDLTYEDIQALCDKDGVLNISYPPTPEMKNIKMWPPYEDVIKNLQELK